MASSYQPRFIVIGNSENRRIVLFQRALRELTLPPAEVVDWLTFLQDPTVVEALSPKHALVRIDSAGENFLVDKELLRLGYDDALVEALPALSPQQISSLAYERGRILHPRQLHLGFLRALDRLADICRRRPKWRLLNHPDSIATLFDKRQTSRIYAQAKIPVPPILAGVVNYDGLLAKMREEGHSSVFIKLAHGSSASGLGVFSVRSNGVSNRASMMTTIAVEGNRWYNSRRLQRVGPKQNLAGLVDELCRQGVQIEVNVPKARLDGAFFDCRVLVVNGEIAFSIVRQSRHPITNLHLGGWRGDLTALAAAVPPEIHAAAMDSCRRVSQCHRSFQVGVDLMYEARFKGHRILEANAFGDLLPNLRREGLCVYGWQIREALRQFTPSDETPV